jgi:hypothetical protein
MSEPEYLICLNCESPTYAFEWGAEKVVSALCETCGNDDLAEFMTESEYEDMIS